MKSYGMEAAASYPESTPQSLRMLPLSQKRFLHVCLLGAVLTLAGSLRLAGISWGLQRGYHPDEVVSVRGVVQLDPLKGDFTAPAAYFEGTFNYYLWSLPVAAIRLFDPSSDQAWHPKSDDRLDDRHYNWILLVSRLMTAGFGTATVLAVYLAAREALHSFYPALVGAALYAIIPVQVIYSHFMRPHVLADFLSTLVLYFSFELSRTNRKPPLLWAGLFSGLTAATRYPLGAIVIVPCLCSILASAKPITGEQRSLLRALRSFSAGPLWWIAFGVVIGLFLGDPMIFFDPKAVIAGFVKDSMRFIPLQQFQGWHFIDPTAIWRYVSVLIPCATWPALWILFYSAALYVLCARRLFHITTPLLVFCLFYLYFMAKGYSNAAFARATMPLFPSFCIIAAVACHLFFHQLRPRASIRAFAICLIVLLAAPSLAFDLAYLRGMEAPDPRDELRSDLKQLLRGAPVKIAVDRSGGYFYTVFPVLKSLKQVGFTFGLQRPEEPADAYLVTHRTPDLPKNRRRTVRHVQARGNFLLAKEYGVVPHFFSYRPNLWAFPSDMTYPFFEILLFRAKEAPPSAPADRPSSHRSDE